MRAVALGQLADADEPHLALLAELEHRVVTAVGEEAIQCGAAAQAVPQQDIEPVTAQPAQALLRGGDQRLRRAVIGCLGRVGVVRAVLGLDQHLRVLAQRLAQLPLAVAVIVAGGGVDQVDPCRDDRADSGAELCRVLGGAAGGAKADLRHLQSGLPQSSIQHGRSLPCL